MTLRRAAVGCALALCASACALWARPVARVPYRPDRRDYAAFRAAFPDVLEPNYLPFMVHRIPQGGGRDDVLVLCHWDESEMPLPVYVEAPDIRRLLEDEFVQRDAADYVRAAWRALRSWESELEGLVRFRRVDDPDDARLVIHLVGARAPVPEGNVQVLGVTSLAESCRARGWYPDADRMRVRFDVPELRIFVADEFGLLSDDQVEWIALHEIGHALGMRGHSPIPADLMYEVVRDRVRVRGLSVEDVNSFVSLYRLPSGTVFGRVPPRGRPERPDPEPPTGPPVLSLAPYVDPRLGFSLKTPVGWMRLDTGQGMVAVDGVTWDYTASFQVVVQRYDTIEEYLDRFTPHYLRSGRLLHREWLVVNGRRALQALIEERDEPTLEEVTFIETGDGRVVVVTADCPAAHYFAYKPWFRETLETLQIWDFSRMRPRRQGPDPG